MKFINRYCNWLQKDNPTGVPDRFPELKNKFETSTPGLYCIGDLTGVPLIKLAAESGHEIIERLADDASFQSDRRKFGSADIYDLIIVGAGPSGMAACLRAQERGIRLLVIESSRKFTTINNFPTGKPIYVTPVDPPMKSALKFNDGTKESLLAELFGDIQGRTIPLHEGETVKRIIRAPFFFTVESARASYKALRVIVAIGKTGNARTLGVPGENLPKVFTRLIDPGEYHDTDIVVVGGGDSAIEAAIALAKAGNRVTLSYRGESLSRPKERNRAVFEALAARGAITPLFRSTVKEIREHDVIIHDPTGERVIANQAVFVLIGAEFPLAFFKRSSIRMEGERRFADRVKIAALLLFAAVLYFGKSAPATPVATVKDFFGIPALLMHQSWVHAACGLSGWCSLMALTVCLAYLAGHFIKERRRYCTSIWHCFKYAYYLSIAIFFMCMFIAYTYLGAHPLFGDMGGWYTALYSMTIVIFGLRRIAVKPTGYIKRQTALLMAIQVVPLFILPMFVFPFLAQHGLLSGWVKANVFPDGSYWRSYGFVLAWPLFIHNLATGQPTLFWLIAGVFQTFVVVPLIVYKWGKGAYCGWICSCGALAESLGDEYRTRAPHGPMAKKLENAGQAVLLFAVLVTVLALLAGTKGTPWSGFASDMYALLVDIVFAGVLGLGVYFFMSGRVWCRFLCPLAALMHIYARFSAYRIFADKKRCISCAICTRVCHMGIDVMGYANKGIPMNDVECVRCSACVVSCPLQVLSFGNLPGPDVDNVAYKKTIRAVPWGWESGLPLQPGETSVEPPSTAHTHGG